MLFRVLVFFLMKFKYVVPVSGRNIRGNVKIVSNLRFWLLEFLECFMMRNK